MIWPEDTVMTDIPFEDSIMLNDQSVSHGVNESDDVLNKYCR